MLARWQFVHHEMPTHHTTKMTTKNALIVFTLIITAMTSSALAKSGRGAWGDGRLVRSSRSFLSSGKIGGSTARSYGFGSSYLAPKNTTLKYTAQKYRVPKIASPSVHVERPKVYTPPGVQNYSTTTVRPFVKRDGTYVAPMFRSTPNQSVNDNWSTKGNYNPFTGAKGAQSLMQPGELR